MRARVVFGFLGTRLDDGKSQERWNKWRPTVALCQNPDFFVDRLVLIHDRKSGSLAQLVASDIAEVSPATQVIPNILNLRDPWDFGEVYAAMRDFAQSYEFDPDAEDYYVNITTGTHVVQICWFLLAETRFVPAKLLQLSPPRNPQGRAVASSHSIIDLDLSKYDVIARRFREEKGAATSFLKSGIETRNPAFNAIIDQIEKIAIKSSAAILLTGPTGAGKSHLARRIYELKKSQHKVKGHFVEVNCATLRGDQAMATLFGHVKGSFTGATSDRPGLMSGAHEGVLFMDEIGELGPDEQAMCLRAIEEKRFLRVGADKETLVDFQLIAGTNKDLGAEVRVGRFRDDLLARLNLWTFELPALKDRREDIEPNLEHELRRYSDREGENASFNLEARQFYLDFALSEAAEWSSNFRDLGASVTRMATLAPSGRIDVATARREIETLKLTWGRGARKSSERGDFRLVNAALGERGLSGIDLFDRAQLEAVLQVCVRSRSLSEAGRTLFAATRQNKSSSNDADRLRKYLARFGLEFEVVKTLALPA
jgi:transcriptional regulatory protein RtcR